MAAVSTLSAVESGPSMEDQTYWYGEMRPIITAAAIICHQREKPSSSFARAA